MLSIEARIIDVIRGQMNSFEKVVAAVRGRLEPARRLCQHCQADAMIVGKKKYSRDIVGYFELFEVVRML
jgi:hypothetical protein